MRVESCALSASLYRARDFCDLAHERERPFFLGLPSTSASNTYPSGCSEPHRKAPSFSPILPLCSAEAMSLSLARNLRYSLSLARSYPILTFARTESIRFSGGGGAYVISLLCRCCGNIAPATTHTIALPRRLSLICFGLSVLHKSKE